MKNVGDSNLREQVNAEAVAIVGPTILDGNGGAPIKEGVILIEGKRISAVGDHTTSIPPHAKRIDARGKFAMPGVMYPYAYLVPNFWPPDLSRCEGRFDEVAIEAAQLCLKEGVTTVFESMGPRDAMIKARDAINEGRATGARIYVSGSWIGLGGPFSPDQYDHGEKDVGEVSPERAWKSAIATADPAFKARINAVWEANVGERLTRMTLEEVRDEIRKHLESGVDFLIYLVNAHRLGAYQFVVFSPRVQRMIVEEAHRAGLRVIAIFATNEEAVHMTLEAGVDMVFHAPWETGNPLSAETLALLARRKVFVNVQAHPAEAVEWARRQRPESGFPGLAKAMAETGLTDRGLIRAGARIIATGVNQLSSPEGVTVLSSGTAPGAYQQIGEGHVRTLQGLLDNGMTPMDALLTMTRSVAEAFNVGKDLGTLERAKIADLLILNKNPLDNVQNYRAIHLVMKEGKIVDRDALPTQRLMTASCT